MGNPQTATATMEMDHDGGNIHIRLEVVFYHISCFLRSLGIQVLVFSLAEWNWEHVKTNLVITLFLQLQVMYTTRQAEEEELRRLTEDAPGVQFHL